MPDLASLLAYCTDLGRVCPNPGPWMELWEMLPGRTEDEDGSTPPPPLVINTWWHATEEEKAQRFRLHVEWAAEHGALEAVDAFLRGLDESEWLHEGGPVHDVYREEE